MLKLIIISAILFLQLINLFNDLNNNIFVQSVNQFDNDKPFLNYSNYIIKQFKKLFLFNLIKEWNNFKLNYNRKFENVIHELRRFIIFTYNYYVIYRHNEAFKLGKVNYEMKINQFSDHLQSELLHLNGYKSSNIDYPTVKFVYKSQNLRNLPREIDWRSKGAVTPIKDQGQCGSCWAFSTTGSIEGQNYLKHNQLNSLSEQQLVDCSSKFDNYGCEGGLMINAFKYIMENDGVDTESSYPYTSGNSGHANPHCKFNRSSIGAKVVNYVRIHSGDEEALQEIVASIGPVSVGIDADENGFLFYKSGVYISSHCGSRSSDLNHAVLVVGYGEEKGKPYWLVKNSWGTEWGDKGYIKMARNHKNMCGIATDASYPIV